MELHSVDYVTMGFPTPSETFTALDVVGLVARGLEVQVHALRPRHPDHHALVAERGLSDVPTDHATPSTLWSGVAAALASPRAAFVLGATLFARCWRQPRQLVKSLVLAPRALEIYGGIRRRRPQVVHLCWAHLPSMVGLLVQIGLDDVAVSLSFSAYDIDKRYGLSPVVARRARLLRTLGRSNVAEIADWLGVPESRIEVIPDGIRLDAFATETEVERVPGRVVSIGRLVHEKGMDTVIDAFARVHAEHPDSSLVVFGDGPERGNLERRAQRHGLSDAVTFVGHRPQPQVLQELLRAEVFLFLSRTERLPNVVKEALAAGCACVSSATFGVFELIPDPDHGTVVAIDDVDAAARATSRYLRDSEARCEAGMRGRRHIVEAFDIERSLDRYLELWRVLAREPLSTAQLPNTSEGV